MKLAVFDFDSTLMDGETIDLLARAHGSTQEVSDITKEARAGKHDVDPSLKKRVKTLKGMTLQQVCVVCEGLNYNKGAQEIMKI